MTKVNTTKLIAYFSDDGFDFEPITQGVIVPHLGLVTREEIEELKKLFYNDSFHNTLGEVLLEIAKEEGISRKTSLLIAILHEGIVSYAEYYEQCYSLTLPLTEAVLEYIASSKGEIPLEFFVFEHRVQAGGSPRDEGKITPDTVRFKKRGDLEVQIPVAFLHLCDEIAHRCKKRKFKNLVKYYKAKIQNSIFIADISAINNINFTKEGLTLETFFDDIPSFLDGYYVERFDIIADTYAKSVSVKKLFAEDWSAKRIEQILKEDFSVISKVANNGNLNDIEVKGGDIIYVFDVSPKKGYKICELKVHNTSDVAAQM